MCIFIYLDLCMSPLPQHVCVQTLTLICTVDQLSLRKARAGTQAEIWRQKPKQRSWRNIAYWLALRWLTHFPFLYNPGPPLWKWPWPIVC